MAQMVESPRTDFPSVEENEYVYRPVSPMAVLSLVLGVVGLLSLTATEDLGVYTFGVLPVLGILVGLASIKAVRRYDAAGMGLARTGLTFSLITLFGGYGIIAYSAAFEVPEGAIAITYDQLQPKPGEAIASEAQALDGKRVFIKGYVYPGNELTGIKKFMLCRDNGTCCFGGQPKLTDMIEVTLKDPLSLDFSTGLRRVAGTLSVRPDESFNGLGGVVYHMEADYLR